MNQVIELLKSWGYDPKVNDKGTNNEIIFKSFGSDNFTQEQKDKVRLILGWRLMEFFYGGDKQSIFVWKQDDRIEKALNASASAIYFADNSDYLTYHYEVVCALTGKDEVNENEVGTIYHFLNSESK